jgi:hypothetical protein
MLGGTVTPIVPTLPPKYYDEKRCTGCQFDQQEASFSFARPNLGPILRAQESLLLSLPGLRSRLSRREISCFTQMLRVRCGTKWQNTRHTAASDGQCAMRSPLCARGAFTSLIPSSNSHPLPCAPALRSCVGCVGACPGLHGPTARTRNRKHQGVD